MVCRNSRSKQSINVEKPVSLSEFFDGLMVRSGQSMAAGCAWDGAILRSHASRSIRRAQK